MSPAACFSEVRSAAPGGGGGRPGPTPLPPLQLVRWSLGRPLQTAWRLELTRVDPGRPCSLSIINMADGRGPVPTNSAHRTGIQPQPAADRSGPGMGVGGRVHPCCSPAPLDPHRGAVSKQTAGADLSRPGDTPPPPPGLQ